MAVARKLPQSLSTAPVSEPAPVKVKKRKKQRFDGDAIARGWKKRSQVLGYVTLLGVLAILLVFGFRDWDPGQASHEFGKWYFALALYATPFTGLGAVFCYWRCWIMRVPSYTGRYAGYKEGGNLQDHPFVKRHQENVKRQQAVEEAAKQREAALHPLSPAEKIAAALQRQREALEVSTAAEREIEALLPHVTK